ncbi:hypothetical protein [Bacillus sp. AK031]
MAGNIVWNFAFALFGFSLYFFLAFVDGEPKEVLTGSFITSLIFFIIMFIVRFFVQSGLNDDRIPSGDVTGEPGKPEGQKEREISADIGKSYDEQEIAAAIQHLLKDE